MGPPHSAWGYLDSGDDDNLRKALEAAGESAAELLRSAIAHRSSRIKHCAARAVGMLRDASFVPELCAAAEGGNQNAIWALGEIGDSRATPVLGRILRSAADTSTYRGILAAVCKVKDPRAAEDLCAFLDKIPLIELVYSTFTLREMRISAAELLSESASPYDVNGLAILANVGSAEGRASALARIRELGEVAVRALRELAQEKKNLAYFAAATLEQLHETVSPRVWTRLLLCDDWTLKERIIETLVKTGGPQAASALIPLLHDRDKATQKAAAEALTKLGPEAALIGHGFLKQEYGRKYDLQSAVRDLGPEAFDHLCSLLRDSNKTP